MKAIVVFKKGEQPEFVTNFPEPVSKHDNEILINVKAVAIKHLDKGRASGKHYSSIDKNAQPIVVGSDGVGIMENGKRVYALGITGTMAEQAIVNKKTLVAIPNGLDDATAAALPNGIMGSAMALRFRAKMKSGETVLINGATGFTGMLAVQIAKYYGAKKIIVTGRNENVLQYLKTIGVDEIINLKQTDENIINQIKQLHVQTPVDIVLDYIWGHPAELLLTALRGDGHYSHNIRYITIGCMASDSIALSSSILRSTDLQISGSGLGSWTNDEMKILVAEILPEILQLVADGKIKINTVKTPMIDFESAWNKETSNAERLVIMI